MIRVIHINDARGGPDEINIMRPNRHGNPFRIGADGSRTQVLCKFAAWAPRQPWFVEACLELRDKTLVCCCKPKACHGDLWAHWAGLL